MEPVVKTQFLEVTFFKISFSTFSCSFYVKVNPSVKLLRRSILMIDVNRYWRLIKSIESGWFIIQSVYSYKIRIYRKYVKTINFQVGSRLRISLRRVDWARCQNGSEMSRIWMISAGWIDGRWRELHCIRLRFWNAIEGNRLSLWGCESVTYFWLFSSWQTYTRAAFVRVVSVATFRVFIQKHSSLTASFYSKNGASGRCCKWKTIELFTCTWPTSKKRTASSNDLILIIKMPVIWLWLSMNSFCCCSCCCCSSWLVGWLVGWLVFIWFSSFCSQQIKWNQLHVNWHRRNIDWVQNEVVTNLKGHKLHCSFHVWFDVRRPVILPFSCNNSRHINYVFMGSWSDSKCQRWLLINLSTISTFIVSKTSPAKECWWNGRCFFPFLVCLHQISFIFQCMNSFMANYLPI